MIITTLQCILLWIQVPLETILLRTYKTCKIQEHSLKTLVTDSWFNHPLQSGSILLRIQHNSRIYFFSELITVTKTLEDSPQFYNLMELYNMNKWTIHCMQVRFELLLYFNSNVYYFYTEILLIINRKL